MLAVSPRAMISFHNKALLARKDKFVRWLRSSGSAVGHFSRGQAENAFDAFLDEATQAGIDTDQRLFEYVAARLLMPDMNGLQYIQALDVIFSVQSETRRIAALIAVGGRSHG